VHSYCSSLSIREPISYILRGYDKVDDKIEYNNGPAVEIYDIDIIVVKTITPTTTSNKVSNSGMVISIPTLTLSSDDSFVFQSNSTSLNPSTTLTDMNTPHELYIVAVITSIAFLTLNFLVLVIFFGGIYLFIKSKTRHLISFNFKK
jgi:hypothetical protein